MHGLMVACQVPLYNRCWKVLFFTDCHTRVAREAKSEIQTLVPCL